MGCSVSRSSPPFHLTTTTTTITATATVSNHNPPSNSSNNSPSPFHYCSPFSDHYYNSSPVSRTMSMPIPHPLIHHPPLRKGDSNHFVSLTSTTYGCLTTTTTTTTTTIAATDSRKTIEKSPVSSPDSVINTWELMEGLDDQFDMNNVGYCSNKPNSYNEIIMEKSETKPLWKHLSDESNLSKTDANLNLNSSYNKGVCCLSSCEDKIVLYYTSLRGIRKTYEDCCEIRLILKGYRVFVDERDISMDSSYRNELKSLFEGRGFTLPQVFIRGKHIGGADEIKRLHEEGRLVGFMKGFRVIDSGFVCDCCGDVRFVPCSNCNGSRKVFEEDEGRSVRCPRCNENGLIRCASCCF